ncbi:MAG: GIY-YIG nuclease family protein [Bacteroidota bacterium]
MYYIYILHSLQADKFYVGSSEDPNRRVMEHNTSPHNTFTSKHRPWVLVASFPVGETRAIAVRYERKLKSLKSKNIILELIRHNGDLDFFAQLVRVPTGRD